MKKASHRCMALLIAISLILSLVFSVTAVAVNDLDSVEKTEIISSSTQACGDSWEWTGTGDRIAALPYGEIYADEIFVAAICSPYWTSNHYTAEAMQTTVTFTSGEGLVTIALRNRQEDVIWGGADCVFAEITPTAAGEAITETTTVSGTFQMFYAAWGSYCEVPFEIVLKPTDEAGDEPAAKTEVISESTAACGDDWSWTGDGDKIASLPSGQITADQIYVVAVCTPYWTDNHYTTEATETTVTFTSGEGLVTIALRNRQEDVIWGGTECVFAEITPTEAAKTLTEDTIVSGTFQMFYAPWGVTCEVPFSVTIQIPKTECTHNNMENFYCTDCGYFDEAALQSAIDLNADGKITAFDAQMLAEANAGLRQLSNDQLAALGTLTVSDIVDYVLGRYKMPTQT